MAEQEKKKKKGTRRLLRVGFVILLLVVGLGPLLLLISYTRDINLVEYLHRQPVQEGETAPEPLEREPYLVQYLYRFCDHSSVYEPDSIPPELDLPPAALVEMAVALHESDTSIQNIMSHLKDTAGWYVADMRVGSEGSYFTFTYLDDFCPACEKCYYLGIYNDGEDDLIAVFQGKPPRGKLIKVTGYRVRDDLWEKLEKGDIFESLDELDSILEAYTS